MSNNEDNIDEAGETEQPSVEQTPLSQLEQLLVNRYIKEQTKLFEADWKAFLTKWQMNWVGAYIKLRPNDKDHQSQLNSHTKTFTQLFLGARKEAMTKFVIEKAVKDLEEAQKRLSEMQEELGIYQEEMEQQHHAE